MISKKLLDTPSMLSSMGITTCEEEGDKEKTVSIKNDSKIEPKSKTKNTMEELTTNTESKRKRRQ
jgi:hypothetical protein